MGLLVLPERWTRILTVQEVLTSLHVLPLLDKALTITLPGTSLTAHFSCSSLWLEMPFRELMPQLSWALILQERNAGHRVLLQLAPFSTLTNGTLICTLARSETWLSFLISLSPGPMHKQILFLEQVLNIIFSTPTTTVWAAAKIWKEPFSFLLLSIHSQSSQNDLFSSFYSLA